MRKAWQLAAVAVLCLFLVSPASAAEKIYVNGIDANFPPFAYVDKKGVPDGFDIKALDWIAKDQGFKVKHQPQDWDSIVPSLLAKKIDIVASGMSITDARKKQVNFSIPYWKIQQVLVARKDARLTVEQVLAAGSKIGVQRGTTEAKWIDENLIKKKGLKFQLVQYDSAPLAIEDVLNGRIAAAAMDDAPAKDAISKKKAVKILGTFGMPDEQFGYALRKEDTVFLGKINAGLKKLMKTPYWKELVKTYIDKK
ncbi:MAG: amino acid ABC transporter substrate-binding protein [Syntrophaceae bacterium]|nr:amino acid ABC transporter substrate-binding protein [Syntrophaceae bacterium]